MRTESDADLAEHAATYAKESFWPRFSLHRRVTVLVLVFSALVVGIIATVSIPLELFPRGFTSPFLSIWIPWREAPPKEVFEKISNPLEEELRTVRGIDRVTSVSRTGTARVFMSFKQGTDMDLAYREVRDRIERARRQFPSDVDRVYTFKEDASGIPVFVMGVAVDSSVTDYYNLIQKQIVLPIERIDGVASLEVNGLEEKEILIELDRERTAAAGLNIYQLAQDLAGDNFSLASGHVMDGNRKLLLRSMAKYTSLEEIENRMLTPNVRVKDVATLRYEEAEKRYRVRAMSKPAYAVVVFKEGEANTRAVTAEIRKAMREMQANPRLAGVEIISLFDQGDVIEESLQTLLEAGYIGGLFSAMVLLFFLRRLRVTLVVNLAIPLSLFIALIVMFFAGETLNILTLLALMMSVGMLVDNSVVVSENIDRLHKAGLSRRDAAVRGTSEIALAITLSTMTSVTVFLPVSLVEGPGQFFLVRMAIPITVALLASLVVAMMIVPLGVYLTLPHRAAGLETGRREAAPENRLSRFLWHAYEVSFGRLHDAYNRWLDFALRHRFDVVMVLFVVFAVTGALTAKEIRFVDTQENEEGGFSIDVEMPENYTLEDTEAWFLKAEKVVETHRDELGLEGWFHFHRKNMGEIEGWFTNPRSSKLTPKQVTERVVELLPKTPGVRLRTGADNENADNEGENVYSVRLHGEDPTSLEDVAMQLEDFFVTLPGVLGVRRSSERSPNELAFVVDRDRAQRYGVDPRAVAGVIGYALRGQALPKHRDEGKEIPVRVRFREDDRNSLTELESFGVPTASGAMLPLSALADVQVMSSAETIVRRDKRITRVVALDLKEDSAKDTRAALSAMVRRIDLPEGITFTEETGQQFNEDLAGLQFAGVLSIVFIYLLMGLLFESFILPLSIIMTIPLASLGVLWIHLALGLDIDFLGAVGCVLLVGVVVNNGIVLIDYVNRLRASGMPRHRALLLGNDRRFRPIMMTALTTIGGMLPLAISGRMDSGISYTSFALTLIGGMTTATALTLLIVPVFYSFFDDLRLSFGAALRRVAVRGGRKDVAPAA
jgi:HAE1 family hydrophobic/amphiphilic exporter-1